MDFRFLVNVDCCISDDRYGYFFYKNRSLSHNDLRLYSPSTLGDAGSFKEQSSDIRSYINRFPHTISKYQLIFVLQRTITLEPDWDHSLLRKILEIDHQLKRSGIVDYDGNNVDCCISVFVIHRLESNYDTQIDKTAYTDRRLAEECQLLADCLGLPESGIYDYEELKSCYEAYKQQAAPSETIIRLLEQMIANAETAGRISVADYIKTHIVSKYLVNEQFVNNAKVREETCAIFRVIEYVTTDLPRSDANVIGYSDRCKDYWEGIMQIPLQQIEMKYAFLLGLYRDNLLHYIDYIDKTDDVDDLDKLPECIVPEEDEIVAENLYYGNEENTEKKIQEPNKIIEEFEEHMSPDKVLSGKWESTFRSLMEYAEDMDKQLKAYQTELKHKYADIQMERQRKFVADIGKAYSSDRKTETDIEQLKDEREKVLTQLRESQIAPHILYQNQLNFENKIKHANENIEFYIDCIAAIKRKTFLLLILILVSFLLLFYLMLQPGVIFSNSVIYAGAYFGLIIVLMACCWGIPRMRYRNNIKRCLKELKKSIESDLSNYKENAKKLRAYVNYSNILDYIERQIKLKEKAISDSNMRENARKYYLNKARSIADSVDSFDDLIKNNYKTGVAPLRDSNEYPRITGDGHVFDIVDCELFWPEEARSEE